MNHLWTPWRMEYIGDKRKGEYLDNCIFCKLCSQPAADDSDIIIARSSHMFALLNRYPYTYGHAMIVPFEHVSSPEDLPTAALTDLMVMTNRVMRVLREIADPPAFNIGANIGAAAGAGIASHYHFHVVPRWPGDANFMVAVGNTQTVPDTLANIQARMRAAWIELFAAPEDAMDETI